MFADGTQGEARTTALVRSYIEIECPIPSIGLTRAIGEGINTESGAPKISIEVPLSIYHGGQAVDFYNFADSLSLSQADLTLISTWHSARLAADNNDKMRSSGGQILKVSGAGFNSSRWYYCIFESSDGNQVYSDPAQPLNVSALECNTAVWPYGAAYVSMTLQVSNPKASVHS